MTIDRTFLENSIAAMSAQRAEKYREMCMCDGALEVAHQMLQRLEQPDAQPAPTTSGTENPTIPASV